MGDSRVKRIIHSKIPIDCGDVIIRKYELKDRKLFYKYTKDKLLCKYLTCSASTDYKTCEAFILGIIAGYESNNLTRFVIADKFTNKFIGVISIYVLKDGKEAELGYWIGREHWNKGYTSKVVCRIVQELSEISGISKVCIEVEERNIASIKVAEKAGMRYNGKQAEEINGMSIVKYELDFEDILVKC